MSDEPPPKKSRFFSDGKSILTSSLGSTSQSCGNEEDKMATSITATQPPVTQPSNIHSSLAPPGFSGIQGPTLLSPTAQAFRELTVEEQNNDKQSRRKGIYGLRDLLAQQGTSTPIVNSSRADEAPTSTKATRLPWLPAVDLDRDVHGRLLPREAIRALQPKLGLRPGLRPRVVRSPSPTPSNELTSPKRVEHAAMAARTILKRKRSLTIQPPPAYVYARTDDPNFNIFSGFLLYPELCFHLASHLSADDLISLYAISRDFHTIIDTRFTTVILNQSLNKAPESSRVFPFRSYGALCRNDPVARIPHPDPREAEKGVTRKIPSFRWLKMVLRREKVVHQIMTIFAEDGVPLPRRCSLSIKKMWYVMDIPDNTRRIGFCHTRTQLTDLDLYFMMVFLVKMDMRLHDPCGSQKTEGMRRLIMSQKSLTVLLKVLRGEIWRNRVDILKEWVKLKWEPRYDQALGFEHAEEDDDRNGDEIMIFGVKRNECGKLKHEYWGAKDNELRLAGKKPELLLRPDQIVLREAIRRGLTFSGHYFKAMCYGYVRPDNLEDFDPREVDRWISEWDGDDYDLDDLAAPVQALPLQHGGGLLDLGRKWDGSEQCVKKPKVSEKEKQAREEEQNLLDQLYVESEGERMNLGLM